MGNIFCPADAIIKENEHLKEELRHAIQTAINQGVKFDRDFEQLRKSMLAVDKGLSGYSKVFKGHAKPVDCVCALSNGTVASSSQDFHIKIWDFMSGKCLLTLKGHTDFVGHVTESVDGRLISASNDRTIKIWDLQTGECLHTLAGAHTDTVRCVCGMLDNRIASASWDRSVSIWSLENATSPK